MRLITSLLALSTLACGPPTSSGGGGGSSSRTRCATNDDCRADFICESSRCVRGEGGGSSDAGSVAGDGGAQPPPTDGGGVVVADAGAPVDDGGQGSVCGNGVRELGEFCDDGNRVNNDACTNACEDNVCGDGFLYEGVEQCDDGNRSNGDGCDEMCRTEEQGPICGNGVIEEGEECDDGNTRSGDGCDQTCRIEEDDQDHGDTPEEAMRITVPARVEATIHNGTDRDYFRFFSTATATYVVETTGAVDTVCSIEFTGNLMASDDDGGSGSNCRATARLNAGRTYHIRVQSAGGDTGAYVLTVTR